MVLADQQYEIRRAYDFRKAKRLRGDSASFLTSLVLLAEGNWRTLLSVNWTLKYGVAEGVPQSAQLVSERTLFEITLLLGSAQKRPARAGTVRARICSQLRTVSLPS